MVKVLIYQNKSRLGSNLKTDPFLSIPFRKMINADIAFSLDIQEQKLTLVKNRYGDVQVSWILPDDLFQMLNKCNLPAIYDL